MIVAQLPGDSPHQLEELQSAIAELANVRQQQQEERRKFTDAATSSDSSSLSRTIDASETSMTDWKARATEMELLAESQKARLVEMEKLTLQSMEGKIQAADEEKARMELEINALQVRVHSLEEQIDRYAHADVRVTAALTEVAMAKASEAEASADDIRKQIRHEVEHEFMTNLNEITERYKAAMVESEAASDRKIAELQRIHEAEIAALRDQLSAKHGELAGHTELDEQIKAELAREIGSARSKYLEGLEAQKRQLTAEHEKIVSDVEIKVAAEFDERLRKLEEKHVHELETLRKELENLEHKHQAAVAADSKQEAVLLDLDESDGGHSLASRVAELDKQVIDLQVRRNEERLAYEARVKELEDRHAKEVGKARVEALASTHDDQIEALVTAHKEAVRRLKEEHLRDMADAKKKAEDHDDHASEVTTLKQQAAEREKKLRAQLDEMREQLEAARDELEAEKERLREEIEDEKALIRQELEEEMEQKLAYFAQLVESTDASAAIDALAKEKAAAEIGSFKSIELAKIRREYEQQIAALNVQLEQEKESAAKWQAEVEKLRAELLSSDEQDGHFKSAKPANVDELIASADSSVHVLVTPPTPTPREDLDEHEDDHYVSFSSASEETDKMMRSLTERDAVIKRLQGDLDTVATKAEGQERALAGIVSDMDMVRATMYEGDMTLDERCQQQQGEIETLMARCIVQEEIANGITKEVQKRDRELDKVNAKLKEKTEQLEALEKALDDKDARLQKIMRQVKNVSSLLTDANANLASVDQWNSIRKELDQMRRACGERDEHIQSLESQIKKREYVLKETRSACDSKYAEANDLRKLCIEKETELMAVSNEVERLKHQLATVEDDASNASSSSEVEELRAECKRREKKISDLVGQSRQISSLLGKLHTALVDKEKEADAAKTEVEEKQATLDEIVNELTKAMGGTSDNDLADGGQASPSEVQRLKLETEALQEQLRRRDIHIAALTGGQPPDDSALLDLSSATGELTQHPLGVTTVIHSRDVSQLGEPSQHTLDEDDLLMATVNFSNDALPPSTHVPREPKDPATQRVEEMEAASIVQNRRIAEVGTDCCCCSFKCLFVFNGWQKLVFQL